MSAVRIQIMRRYSGSPELGSIVRVELTDYVQALVREGLVQLLPDPPTDQTGKDGESDG